MHPGQPLITRGIRLLPFAQCVAVQLPVINLRLEWYRPASLLVTNTAGQEQVIPVHDPTRQIVWTLYAAVAAGLIITMLSKHRLRGPK